MKTIEVVAAVICDNNKILATQRGYGTYKDGWEFPGGKIEPGEMPQQALVREISEELNIEIKVEELLEVVHYEYPEFLMKMYCFKCRIKTGKLILNEHKDAKWLEVKALNSVNWLPADQTILPKLKGMIGL